MIQPSYHEPVLTDAVLDGLLVAPGKRYIDATLGGGGHAAGMLARGAIVLGIDQDPDAIAYCKEKFGIQKNIRLVQGNFENIEAIAGRDDFIPVDGVLFDLGMSSHQINASGRGFSFTKDEPLDMRMDKTGTQTASDIINTKKEEELYEIFATYAEELNSRAIARAIIRARALAPIASTRRLREIVEQASGGKPSQGVSARIFQSLRITVNKEIDVLKQGISGGRSVLGPKGRLAVLSYHSLEDRVIKKSFSQWQRNGWGREIHRHPLRPTYEESWKNSRSRSARLRIFESV